MSNRSISRRPGGSPATSTSTGRSPGNLTPGEVNRGKSPSIVKASTKGALKEVGKVVKPSNPRDGRYSATSSNSIRTSTPSSSSSLWAGSDVKNQSSSGTGTASSKKSAKSKPPVVRQSPSRSSDKPDARASSQASDRRAQAKASLISRSRSDDSEATVELRKKHADSTVSPYKPPRAKDAVKPAHLAGSDSSSPASVSDTASSSSLVDSSDSSFVFDSRGSSITADSKDSFARTQSTVQSSGGKPKTPSSKWDDVRALVFNSAGQIPDYYQQQVILDLQKLLDPNLDIPLVVDAVKFGADGNLASISVVTNADSKSIKKQHSRLPGPDRSPDKGSAQKLAAGKKKKSIPMQGGNWEAAWKNTRMGRIAKGQGITVNGFAASLNQAVKNSILQTNKTLTGRVASVLDQVSASLLVNDMLATEGLLRLSPSQAVLGRTMSGIADSTAAASGLLKAGDSDAAILLGVTVKTLLRERSDKVLSVGDVFELNNAIPALGAHEAANRVAGMLAELPPDEVAIWRKAVNLCHNIMLAQQGMGKAMTARNLAMVMWPGLLRSDNPADMGPVNLIEHLIKNAPRYFSQDKPGVQPIRDSATYSAVIDGGRRMPDWVPMLSALSDVRDAFAFLPRRSGISYDGNDAPMRGVFQKGFVRAHVDVPSSFEQSYKDGKFLEFFGRYVNLTPNLGTKGHLDMIDVPLLKACEDLREKMRNKFTGPGKIALLEAISGGKIEQARGLLEASLSAGERQHLHAFFHSLESILAAIEANTKTEHKDELPRETMASNFYNAVVAFLGLSSDELTTLWAAGLADKTQAGAKAAAATKKAAKELVLNAADYFAPPDTSSLVSES
ncbi:RhoGAP domain-containing protein [Lacisediminimonas profundi]|uniref:RhoGAP domain-containing protein n=1 Tax=Lacisediminimonas profundi TaxID=2603856 RepID=UPI001387479C|nr:RhoGAP domain-containing protein [Lacisediminimonas profundi]